ncbi:MAG: transcriptional repressor [Prochlorococcus sp.]|nr:transcriptional repressor [Prochlorococcus sp.]
MTVQRRPINARQEQLLDQLKRFGDEISGQQLHRALQDAQISMGLATVYRHLRQLQQQGLIRCRQLPNGESLYAPVDMDRHHLTCVDCGQTRALNQCPIHDITLPLVNQQGFQVLFHTLEFFGLCTSCQERHAGVNHSNDSPGS